MITEIAYQLIKYLSERVSYIDKWTGIVIPMHKSIAGVDKVIPMSIQTPTDCDVSVYMDLVPDSSKLSVCYCEKQNDVSFEQHSGYLLATQQIRIVLWYNLAKINEGKYLDEGTIIANLITNLPKSLPNSLFTNVKNVRLITIGSSSGSSLFNKYTYNEVKDQYVTFPYGAVAVDVEVFYTEIGRAHV